MGGPGEVYVSKDAASKAANLRKLHSDAAQGAAAAREAGRRVFVYSTARVFMPDADALVLFAEPPSEDLATAAIVEGVESQGWRLEHVVFSSRFNMFFRRLD